MDRPEIDQEVTVKEADAGINGEPVREQEAPVVQDVRASDAGKPEPYKPTKESSPLREDDSWLNNGLKTSKTKKGKIMAKPSSPASLFDSI